MYEYVSVLAFFIFGYLVLLFHPYKATDYMYLPMVIILCIGGLYLFFSIQNTFPFTQYIKKILLYLFLFIALLSFFAILKMIVVYLSRISFFAIFLFYVIFMAIVANQIGQDKTMSEERTHNWLMFIKYLIFYIPCLFLDVIQSIVKDAKQTNMTTYILGLCLFVWVMFYLLFPILRNYMYTLDGILLIDKKTSLNDTILTMTLAELNERINKTWAIGKSVEGFKSISDFDLQRSYTMPEFFISIPYLDDFFIKLKNKFFMIPMPDEVETEVETLHTYHYGISFWLYLDTNILTDANRPKALILSLGSRPSMYYDYDNRQLILEITDHINASEFKQTRVYYSSKLLFQRWNHIVMNYAHGQFDLFINNQLVATQSNVSPYINQNELLQVGSVENTALGGISNFKYYPHPLSLYKIKSIYTQSYLTE